MYPFVLALGDSLTAGYGLPATASFSVKLQHSLRESHATALVQNAGVSGDTTEDALRRLPRVLSSLVRKPDLAIVELGANDLLRGLAPVRTRTNLDQILAVEIVRDRHLAGDVRGAPVFQDACRALRRHVRRRGRKAWCRSRPLLSARRPWQPTADPAGWPPPERQGDRDGRHPFSAKCPLGDRRSAIGQLT